MYSLVTLRPVTSGTSTAVMTYRTIPPGHCQGHRQGHGSALTVSEVSARPLSLNFCYLG